MVHMAFIWGITDEPFVVSQEVSLSLLLRHGTMGVVTMIDDGFYYHNHIVDADHVGCTCQLDSYSSQEFCSVVVGSMYIALFYPGDPS
jgi:hypothetical protein